MSLRMWARDDEALSFGRQSETGLRLKIRKQGYQFIIVQLLEHWKSSIWRFKKDFLVTKQKDTTRSHPEHGRKDFSRRQYSEGSLPGR